jgi:hypothetical protein
MSRHTAAAPARIAQVRPSGPPALVTMVSRMLLAQAGASAAVTMSFGRRTVTSVVLTVLVAIALCALAGVVRSGHHTAWLVSIAFESGFAAVGLFGYTYGWYLGGTLLAIIVLGTLLHPAVARLYAGPATARDHAAGVLADSAGELEAVS